MNLGDHSPTPDEGAMPHEVRWQDAECHIHDLERQVAERTGTLQMLSGAFHYQDGPRIPDSQTATQLYRIAQEAVAKAMDCKQTTRVDISLRSDDSAAALLEICDDGPGMPPGAGRGDGVGLRIMRYRAGLIGARLAIEPRTTGGVRLACRLPKSTT